MPFMTRENQFKSDLLPFVNYPWRQMALCPQQDSSDG
jgi:hypothetical protein